MRRPQVALAPLAVDLWVLYGPRLTPQPAIDAIRDGIGAVADRIGGTPTPALEQAIQSAGAIDLRTAAVGTQLFASLFRGGPAPMQPGGAWAPADGWTLAGLLLALNLGALLLSVLMLLPLGALVAGQPAFSLRRIGAAWWSLLRVCLLIAAFALVVSVPTLLSIGVLFSLSPLASQLALVAVSIAGIAAWLLVDLSAEAVLVGQARPLTAIYQSYNIVRANMPQALLLLIATAVVIHGFAALLRPLATSTAGIVAALALYAIVSGSVAATRMIFYQDRVVRLGRINPVALTQSEV